MVQVSTAFNCNSVEGILCHQLKRKTYDNEKTIILNPSEQQKWVCFWWNVCSAMNLCYLGWSIHLLRHRVERHSYVVFFHGSVQIDLGGDKIHRSVYIISSWNSIPYLMTYDLTYLMILREVVTTFYRWFTTLSVYRWLGPTMQYRLLWAEHCSFCLI